MDTIILERKPKVDTQKNILLEKHPESRMETILICLGAGMVIGGTLVGVFQSSLRTLEIQLAEERIHNAGLVAKAEAWDTFQQTKVLEKIDWDAARLKTPTLGLEHQTAGKNLRIEPETTPVPNPLLDK